MYDKRVVRGNTWALRKMAEEELRLAHDEKNKSKKKTQVPQQNQKLLKPRVQKSTATKNSMNMLPADSARNMNGSIPSSNYKLENKFSNKNANQTPRSDAGVQIADDELIEDAVLNTLVQQTIKVAVDELTEQIKRERKSIQTSDAYTTITRPNSTSSTAVAEAQTDLLNENIDNAFNTSNDNKNDMQELRDYSHTLITNIINDCSEYLNEKIANEDVQNFVLQGLCPIAISIAETIIKVETCKNNAMEELFYSSNRE